MDLIEKVFSEENDVRSIQSDRLTVLRHFYAIRNNYWGANPDDIREDLNLQKDRIDDIIWYEKRKRHLVSPTLGPNVRITSDGVNEVERHC